MDTSLLRNCVENIFVKELEQLRQKNGEPNAPALLLLDGHSSRQGLNGQQLLEKYNIFVLLLPAHSSAILQPLELSVNGSLKTTLKKKFTLQTDESGQAQRSLAIEYVT